VQTPIGMGASQCFGCGVVLRDEHEGERCRSPEGSDFERCHAREKDAAVRRGVILRL
jgi:hypothetical protein